MVAALAAAIPWCAQAALPTNSLTYANDFTGDWSVHQGTGDFTLRSSQPNYIPVPGKDGSQAITFAAGDSSTVHPWGDRQTALPTDAKTFTVAFRAKLGTANNGILFAFGTKSNQEGGLSFRRGNATDSFVVATGSNHSEGRPAYTFTSPTLGAGSYDKGWHTYILTCAPANDSQVTMTLYVDGLQCDQETMANPTHLIKPQFQFGTRHATAFDGEAAGNGAIDTFATWTAALTADEAKTLTEMWDRVPPNFDEAIPALPSGVADILSLGTLAPLSGTTDVRHFSLEQWAPARQGNINAALITGSAVDWVNLYGIFDGSTSFSSTEENPLERSTWMKVTGGKYNRIVGGRTNGHAATIAEGSGNGADSVKGDFNVQLSGPDTTARNLIGGFYGTGDGYNNDAGGAAGKPRSLWGDTSVVVSDGAFVTGGIVGGSVVRFVAKDSTFTHTGNSSVTVHSVLAAPVMDDVHNVTPAGVKPMGIVGGDLNVDIGSLEPRGSEITGSTSVTVDIPEASGTFSMPIYGASVRATAGKAAQESFTQKVGGTSTVTIDAPPRREHADGRLRQRDLYRHCPCHGGD